MRKLKIQFIITVIILPLLSSVALAEGGANVTSLMKKELDGLPNKEGILLIVEYAPGMSSKAHRHDAHSFVYVLQGTVIMQVKGRDPVTLEAGQTFYESPNDIHLVSKNASNTQTARFVVFLLKEKGAPVVIPVL